MPHLDPVPPEAATGILAEEYAEAIRRAGRIWGIVAVQSHNPPALRDSLRLYATLMFGPGPLRRDQRELIAVVTSAVNGCVY
ncbi:MAG: carboxymuconolactone decarboxylase family protein [Acidimicrobiales bacterium]